jgi:NADPH:quinone reductase-like Zn-dependent oxidoreductase
MKALVLADKNKPLVLQEVPDLQAGEGDAIVRVHAAALNHRDVWIQKGQYAGLKFPIVLGSDGTGVVEKLRAASNELRAGGGTPEDWIGKEVIMNPALEWGDSEGFQDPRKFRILGLPDDGTFSEYVRVPIANLVEKPSHLSVEEAAALPLAGATAFRALMIRGRLKAGERVLVTGVGGGVALFAMQFAVAAGAEVFVTSGNQEKMHKAIAMGARGGANYAEAGWVESLQKLGGFDIIIDGAAGNNMDELFNLAAPGGRVVFYGATRGNPSGVTARRIFWKQLDVLGSTMASPKDFQQMIEFVKAHRIRPVVDKVFPFANGEAAMRHMDQAAQFGKIVIKVD